MRIIQRALIGLALSAVSMLAVGQNITITGARGLSNQTAPILLKFDSGYGLKTAGNHAASPGTALDSYLSGLDGYISSELADSASVEFASLWYSWATVEASEGVYDFSEVLSDVAAVAAQGKKAVVVFPFKCFQSDCGSIAPPQHEDVVYDTAGSLMMDLSTDGPGIVAVWQSDVMADYIAMIEAAALVLDNLPAVQLVVPGDEWVLSIPSGVPGGYSFADYRDELYNLIDACTAAFVKTYCGASINATLGGYADELMEYAFQAGGMAKTGPDALDDYGNEVFAGLNGAVRDYRGLMPNYGAWTAPMCGGADDPGDIDAMQALVEEYRFSHVAAISYSADADCDWDTDFVPYFESNVVGLTVYPGTLAADTTSPPAPTISSVVATSSSEITVSWGALASDTFSSSQIVSGIDGTNTYRVRRDSSIVATTSSTSFDDTGLSASTLYTYTVDVKDAAGNYSSQSASDSDTTDAMAGNPDGWPSATETYYARTYETEVSGDVIQDPGLVSCEYGASIGYGGSGAWACYPDNATPACDSSSDENNVGWHYGSDIPADTTDTIVLAYYEFMSTDLLGLFTDPQPDCSPTTYRMGMKREDVTMYASNGADLDNETRQTNIIVEAGQDGASGSLEWLQPAAYSTKVTFRQGGAGIAYWSDPNGSTYVDYETLAGQWVMWIMVYDVDGGTAAYIKRSTDSEPVRVFRRLADDIPVPEYDADPDAPFVYGTRGWAAVKSPYWDNVAEVGSISTYEMIRDCVVLANGWTEAICE